MNKFSSKYDFLLFDRYIYSDYAYGTSYEKNTEFVWELMTKVPRPDLTFLLDTEPAVALARINKRNKPILTFQENDIILSNARSAFLCLKEQFVFDLIDSTKSEKEVFLECVELMKGKFDCLSNE